MPIEPFYDAKIPARIRHAMASFTAAHCLLVPRRITARDRDAASLHCHMNVRNAVAGKGGRIVHGWLLHRASALLRRGIWCWQFHSVWLQPDGALVDITEDDAYEGKDFSTFWVDAHREVDFASGQAYNNIVLLSAEAARDHFRQFATAQLSSGTVYWTTRDLRYFRGLGEHPGHCRWLREEYPDNLRRFAEAYAGRLDEPDILAANHADYPAEALFDFNLKTG